mmetsp:Transcript_10440/g.27779  ORF Transcript_10440/g.27779 Transcript_10440/m.27779 type:complete len:693 (-) Transcript_10440:512-2590(-)
MQNPLGNAPPQSRAGAALDFDLLSNALASGGGGGGGGKGAAFGGLGGGNGAAARWGSSAVDAGASSAPFASSSSYANFFDSGNGAGGASFAAMQSMQGRAATTRGNVPALYTSAGGDAFGGSSHNLRSGIDSASSFSAFGPLNSVGPSQPQPAFQALQGQRTQQPQQQPHQKVQPPSALNPSDFPSLSSLTGEQQPQQSASGWSQLPSSSTSPPTQHSQQRPFLSSAFNNNNSSSNNSNSAFHGDLSPFGEPDKHTAASSSIAGGIFGFAPSESFRSSHVLSQPRNRSELGFSASTEDFPALSGSDQVESRGLDKHLDSTQPSASTFDAFGAAAGQQRVQNSNPRATPPPSSAYSSLADNYSKPSTSNTMLGKAGGTVHGGSNMNASGSAGLLTELGVPQRPASATPMTMMDAFGAPTVRSSSVGPDQHAHSLRSNAGVIGRGSRSAGTDESAKQDADVYGMQGLLRLMRPAKEPEAANSALLSLGVDLTMLGLNLNATEPLYASLDSLFSAVSSDGEDALGRTGNAGEFKEPPSFEVPECYAKVAEPAVHGAQFARFGVETLFYAFYGFPRDRVQLYAAVELYARKWLYHRERKLWFARLPGTASTAASASAASDTGINGAFGLQQTAQDRGDGSNNSSSSSISMGGTSSNAFLYFDVDSWERRPFHDADRTFTNGFLTESEIRTCLARAG